MPDYRLASLLIALLLADLSGCAGYTTGPAFSIAPAPPANRGRVYIYRADGRNSGAVVKTTINGQEVGTFRDHEYETFEISAGAHRLSAGMRGFAYFRLGWNEHTFRVRPGETVFIQLEMRVDVRGDDVLGRPRELEIGGRPDQQVTENIFIIERPREQALELLARTTRLSRGE
jgi:hypothetical protein